MSGAYKTRPRTPLVDRFWVKVEKTDGCWLWTASKSLDGYGYIDLPNPSTKKVFAHRFAYEQLVGPIPDGYQIDHLCRVRNCVNPAHLEAVTPRVNVLRSSGVAANRARQSHCKRGHELAGDNVYVQPSRPRSRRCMTCMRERVR